MVILLQILVPANTHAQNTIDVVEGGHVSNSFKLEKGDKIHYEFEVVDGPAIDVFLLDDQNYVKYDNGNEFDYYGEGSKLGATYGEIDFKVPKDGKFYVVLDGTNAGEAKFPADLEIGKATVEYSGHATEESSFPPLMMCLAGIISIIVVAVVIIYFVFLREDEEEAPQPINKNTKPRPMKKTPKTENKITSKPPPETEKEEKQSDTQFCKHCGEEIDSDSTYCPECGEPVS